MSCVANCQHLEEAKRMGNGRWLGIIFTRLTAIYGLLTTMPTNGSSHDALLSINLAELDRHDELGDKGKKQDSMHRLFL